MAKKSTRRTTRRRKRRTTRKKKRKRRTTRRRKRRTTRKKKKKRRTTRKKKQHLKRKSSKNGGGEIIREFKLVDAPKVTALIEEAFSYSKLPLPTLKEIRSMKGLVLEHDAKIASYLLFSDFKSTRSKDPLWYYLEYIGTNPKYQKKGFGKKLMKHFVELLDEHELPSFLHVEEGSSYSDTLLQWYPKFGYIKTNEHIPSTKVKKVLMTMMMREKKVSG